MLRVRRNHYNRNLIKKRFFIKTRLFYLTGLLSKKIKKKEKLNPLFPRYKSNLPITFSYKDITYSSVTKFFNKWVNLVNIDKTIPGLPKTYVLRNHWIDILNASENDKDCKRILERYLNNYEVIVHDEPIPGVYYNDLSINFMYAHEINSSLINFENQTLLLCNNSELTNDELVMKTIKFKDINFNNSIITSDGLKMNFNINFNNE